MTKQQEIQLIKDYTLYLLDTNNINNETVTWLTDRISENLCSNRTLVRMIVVTTIKTL